MSRTHASYRPWTIETVTSLIENFLSPLWDNFLSKRIFLSVNADCFGRGRSRISLLSTEITTDTVGLSLANSCTHNRPTCMHLKISISKHGSYTIVSIKAIMLFAFHSFHAWKNKNRIEILSISIENYNKQALEVFKNKAMGYGWLTNPKRLMDCSSW